MDTNDVKLRKDFIRCWTHANPKASSEKTKALYDMLVKLWPEVTRGGHRGMVNRLKPWETVIHTCPKCRLEAQGMTALQELFGFRYYRARGKTYIQSWCRKCRVRAP